MELKDNRELIIALKEAKKKQEMTIPRLLEVLQAKNQTVSRTTLVRLFADGSEDNDSFNYSSTLKPIADVLLADDTETANLEILKLKADLKVKDKTIEKLQTQVETLHIQMQHLREEETRRLDFLKNQIELKDRRMDTKDELIQRVMDRNDKKDKAIADLMEENKRLDETLRQLLDKCKKCNK